MTTFVFSLNLAFFNLNFHSKHLNYMNVKSYFCKCLFFYFMCPMYVQFYVSNSLPEVEPIAGPPPPVTSDLISKALKKMKFRKAAGPSGVVAEMLSTSGEEALRY